MILLIECCRDLESDQMKEFSVVSCFVQQDNLHNWTQFTKFSEGKCNCSNFFRLLPLEVTPADYLHPSLAGSSIVNSF